MTAPSSLPVHPRLRQRRIAVQRAEGRKRLRRLTTVGIAAGVVALAWAVTQSPVLDVDVIAVSGAEHSGVEAVVAASGVERGTPLTSIRVDSVERAVSALPWVATADVHRDWPGRLVIDVVERTPIAVVTAAGGGWAAVDRDGRVLSVGPEALPGLPRLDRVQAPAEPGARLDPAVGALTVVAALPPDLAAAVASVEVGDELALHLHAGGAVRVGAPDDLEAKVLAIATVLAEVDLASLAELDVSVPGSPVLTRR